MNYRDCIFWPKILGRNHSFTYTCFRSRSKILLPTFQVFLLILESSPTPGVDFGPKITQTNINFTSKQRKFRNYVQNIFLGSETLLRSIWDGPKSPFRYHESEKARFADCCAQNFGHVRPATNFFGPCVLNSKTASKILPDHILQHINISHSF